MTSRPDDPQVIRLEMGPMLGVTSAGPTFMDDMAWTLSWLLGPLGPLGLLGSVGEVAKVVKIVA